MWYQGVSSSRLEHLTLSVFEERAKWAWWAKSPQFTEHILCQNRITMQPIQDPCVLATVVSLDYVNACPDDVILGVYNCLRHVASDDTGLTAGHDVQILRSKCLDGSFDITISCVQDLKYSCRHDSTKLDVIHRTVDVAQMRSAFEYACDNIEVQAEAAGCVSRYKDNINECCSRVESEFRREKEYAYTSELYLELICSFIDAITLCTERPARLYCSADSSAVTVRLMAGLKPPGCLPYTSSAAQAKNSLVATILLLFTIIAIRFLSQ